VLLLNLVHCTQPLGNWRKGNLKKTGYESASMRCSSMISVSLHNDVWYIVLIICTERTFEEDEIDPAMCFNNFTHWAIRLQIRCCDWDSDVNFPLNGGAKSIAAAKLEKITELHRKQLVQEYKNQTHQPDAEDECTDHTVVYSFEPWSDSMSTSHYRSTVLIYFLL
jgi:hypothetical protein